MFSNPISFWRHRLQASGLHLVLSLLVAALAAALVFGLWYPSPYRALSDGRELFLLVVTVDVILGPLVTLAIFNRRKPLRILRRDLAVVALLQFAALGYGLWTVSLARPVHMVFEIDRLRVVHAVDVPPELLTHTPTGIDALPLTGPSLLAVREFKNSAENMDATMAALQGLQLSFRPDLWQPYAQSAPDVLKAAKPVAQLQQRFPAQQAAIEQALRESGRDPATALYLPVVGRKVFWTALIDPATAEPFAYLPIDSF